MRRRFFTTLLASTTNLNKKTEALAALRKAWEAGFRDSVWARRDPDLSALHGDEEFERLYPERPGSASA